MVRPHGILDTSMSIVSIMHGHIAIAVMHLRAGHGRRGRVGTSGGCYNDGGASMIVVILVASWRLLLMLGREVARHLLVLNGAVVSTRATSGVGVRLPLRIHDGRRSRAPGSQRVVLCCRQRPIVDPPRRRRRRQRRRGLLSRLVVVVSPSSLSSPIYCRVGGWRRRVVKCGCWPVRGENTSSLCQ